MVQRNKLRRVLPGRYRNANSTAGAGTVVIFLQPLTKTVRFHSNNRVSLLIEIGWTPECFDCDIVFLNLVRLAFEMACADVLQKRRETRRAGENTGPE